MSEPVAGNHSDLYEIEVRFEVVTATQAMAGIPVEGLFLNADAGFHSVNLRNRCGAKGINANICFNRRSGNTDREENFDGELYGQRYVVERTNAWMPVRPARAGTATVHC